MEGHKVVTAEEMVRVERGLDPEAAMAKAGRHVAEAAMQFIESHHLPKRVTLLVGKGNNGGDAYAAGLWLLDEGFSVTAWAIDAKGSPLNQKFREKYRKQRGRFAEGVDGLIIDGLLGTGFKGKVDKKVAALIQTANASGLPILAVDLPSGLNGTTGMADVAIRATETVTLGLPKIGLFIQEGWNYVGKLQIADIGLSKESIAEAEAIAYLPKRLELPPIVRIRHKYQAGYVIGYAGSKEFSGSAKMAGFAALKAGAG
ncbi:MAG: NAD(P)H-hydrate epimerase, partial [Verrucomicrobiota bacterium]|nr:NAD(P)H-hydrate epimerase [Verrucomicrobiota bacterium]